MEKINNTELLEHVTFDNLSEYLAENGMWGSEQVLDFLLHNDPGLLDRWMEG